MKSLGTFLIVFLLSAVATYCVRLWALRRNVLDQPNSRSSHTVPTPRGGGVSIVLIFALFLFLVVAQGVEVERWVYAFAAGGLVAIVGLMDDLRPTPALIRLFFHFVSAVLAYGFLSQWFFDPFSLDVYGVYIDRPLFVIPISILFLIWMTNLYNFMDGIDGLAGVQGITFGLGYFLFALWVGHTEVGGYAFVLAAAISGFLVFNWQPAKIFMGDVGSGFLGFVFAVLMLIGEQTFAVPLVCSLILMGFFIVDSTFTLVRRVFLGQSPAQAHRDHMYQHAVQLGWSHRKVSLGVGVINLIWLLPIAIGTGLKPEYALYFFVLAYAPLVALAVYFRAGKPLDVSSSSSKA